MWVGVAELEVERCWGPLDRQGNNCIERNTWIFMDRLFVDKNWVTQVVQQRWIVQWGQCDLSVVDNTRAVVDTTRSEKSQQLLYETEVYSYLN